MTGQYSRYNAELPKRQQLTKRQAEVAKLVAAGYTNLQIAQALSIEEGVVSNYLSNIYGILEIKGLLNKRVRLARWASEHL